LPTGTCHCGAVTWRYDKQPSQATACNCSICVRYGVLWIYGIDGEDVHVDGPTRVYTRADQDNLEFHFCPTCGNCISWRAAQPDDQGKRHRAVNLRLVDAPETVMDIPIRHFDGAGPFKARADDGRTVRDMWF